MRRLLLDTCLELLNMETILLKILWELHNFLTCCPIELNLMEKPLCPGPNPNLPLQIGESSQRNELNCFNAQNLFRPEETAGTLSRPSKAHVFGDLRVPTGRLARQSLHKWELKEPEDHLCTCTSLPEDRHFQEGCPCHRSWRWA